MKRILSALLFGLVTMTAACVDTPEDDEPPARIATEDRGPVDDNPKQPPGPPAPNPPAPPQCLMQQHQTCIVGSLLGGECCANYPRPNPGNQVGGMPCVPVVPGGWVGACDGPRPAPPVPVPVPAPVDVTVADESTRDSL